jgi:hypothetical protein
MKSTATIASAALAELRMLAALEPTLAALKARRMCSSDRDFVRGSLAMIGPWLSTHAGPGRALGGPWVWSIGDAHQGNFSTLAVGQMDREGVVPVTFGVADVDDEAPAPWSWDLLRLLSSMPAAAPKLKRSAFDELCRITCGSYAETMQRFGQGDALAARLDANGLPEALKELILAGSGEDHHKRFLARMVSGAGLKARLQRNAEVVDDPYSAPALRAAWGRLAGLPEHRLLDIARRTNPGGLSSLGRRRWWLLIRESAPVARLRLIELKERAPSALSRVIPMSPFTPWMSPTAPATQPVCSTMGKDPFQRVLRTVAGDCLARTRCHTRATLDIARLDDGDVRRLGHLYGQIIATFHWQGLSQLTPDVDQRCAAIATTALAQSKELVGLSGTLANHLRALAKDFNAQVTPLLRKEKLNV